MAADLLALNHRAAELLQAALQDKREPVLLLDADWPLPGVTATWQRRGTATDDAVWQQDYVGALLGLPRSREELAMNLHLAAARLRPAASRASRPNSRSAI